MVKQFKQQNLRIIPIGGLGEVGRNMILLEYQEAILIIDMGFRMPEEDMPGVDYIIPNINYLTEQQRYKNIAGVIISHAHYDHIGAIPYIIGKIGNPPIFTAALTKGIILKRQEEFPNQPKLEIHEVKEGSKIHLGPFNVEFFRQNHNVPDTLGFLIKTPAGNIVYTADFKFDPHPVNEPPTNFQKLQKIGNENILCLMSDSTGAEEEGHSLSEEEIFKNLEKIFQQVKGRIIVATFSSLINRIQQVITLSEMYHRKVAIAGHSMRTNVLIARHLGYIKHQKGTLIKNIKSINKYPDQNLTILCTGAQGEEKAALMRIATKQHPYITIKPGDTIILSSSVIPGNERTVQMVKDDLLKQGAEVFHYKMMDIHAGGHAKAEELKQMIQIMKPKFLMPVHGQYSMLAAHGKIAQSLEIPKKRIILGENGDIIKLTKSYFLILNEKIPANYVMIDGLGLGDVGEVVLRDRQMLAQDGIFVIIAVVSRKNGKVIGSPDVISRGFVYLKESQELLRETRRKIIRTVEKATASGGVVNWTYVKNNIKETLGDFLFEKTQRRPMILPVIIEV